MTERSDLQQLVEAARKARENAYCPYSQYPVGASVLGTDGNVHVGCNVENASSGLTVCAERNAVAAMVAAGGGRIAQVVVVTSNGALPCGACLQVIAEHAASSDIPLHIFSEHDMDNHRTYRLASLLPHPFRKMGG